MRRCISMIGIRVRKMQPNVIAIRDHSSSGCVTFDLNKDHSKKALLRQPQTLAKTAGVVSTVAFATAGAPSVALAKKAAEVVEVVETVDQTKKLLAAGAGAVVAGAAALKLAGGGGPAQGFLEASPHWDQSDIPVNTYKNKAPFTGKVVSTKRIVGPKATGETCHIVIDHEGKFPVSSQDVRCARCWGRNLLMR